MQAGINPKILIAIGFVLIELCLALMTQFSPLSAKGEILRMLYVRGFALAFLFVPINSSILSQFSGINLGQVAGLLNLFRQIGGSAGIALVATLLNSKSHQNYQDLSVQASALSQKAQNFIYGTSSGMTTKMTSDIGFTVNSTASYSSAAIKAYYFKVQNQVFMLTFIQLVYIMMIIMLLSLIPLFRLKIKKGPVAVVNEH